MSSLLVTQCHRPCETYVLECKQDEPVVVNSSAAMIMITEGRFDRVKGRKFEPLCSTNANSGDILLIGCDTVNKAIVCIPRPAFLASETSSDTEQKAENGVAQSSGNLVARPLTDNGVIRPIPENKAQQSADAVEKENRVRKSPSDTAPSGMFVSRPLVPEEPQKHGRIEEPFEMPKTLLKTYGEKVLSVCRKLLENKPVIIRYGEFSLKAVIQKVELDPNAFASRDKSYIKLTMIYTINNQVFVSDHTAFAAEFRKMINGKINTVALSVWQRTFIWYDTDSLGHCLDKIVPYNVRRFYDETDIKEFLLNR